MHSTDKLRILEALQTVEKTMPLLVYRLAVYGGIAVALVLGALLSAGTLYTIGHFLKVPGAFAKLGAIFGFAGVGLVVRWQRASLLHSVVAPHLWLVARWQQGAPLPDSREQRKIGQQALDEQISPRQLRELHEAAGGVLRALPQAAGYRAFGRPAGAWLGWIIAWIAPAVWAVGLARHPGDPWAALQRILLSYVRNGVRLTRDAALLALWAKGLAVATVPLWVYVMKSITAGLPVHLLIWNYAGAAVLAWLMYMVFFEPVAQVAMIRILVRLPPARSGDEAGPLEQIDGYRVVRRKATGTSS